MAESLEMLLDLDTAWKRLKREGPHRGFVRHPFELALTELDLPAWLEAIRQDLRTGRYAPGAVTICDAPKGKGAVRPGGILSLRDRLVFIAAVGACFPAIHKAISAWPELVDHAYTLARRPDEIEWLTDPFKAWQRFRERSLAELDKGATHAVIADITAYYENIDLPTLISDLIATGAPKSVVDLLSNCLNRWAQVNSRGIPQGHSASDILGKLYLNRVDRALRDRGYLHYRYVDDFRIFAKDHATAKRSLVELTRLLRRRGLNIQSSKSAIHIAHDARKKIDGITPTIEPVRDRYVKELADTLDVPYATIADLEKLMSSKAE
jgi:hypothetical protein